MKPRQPAPAARCQSRRAPARWMSSETKEDSSARHRPTLPRLRDQGRSRGRRCLPQVLRAARACLRQGRARPHRHPRAHRRRPQLIWRYAPLLPVAPPAEPRLAPGLTPLVRAPRLAEAVGVGELWLKLDTANPTHSFKDRVVGGSLRQGPGARPHHDRVLFDGEPRQRRRRSRGRRGPGSGRLLPRRPRAGEARGHRRVRRDRLRRGRHVRRLLAPDRRALLRAPLGVRQRRPADVLRRGLQDARVRDRRAARLADAVRRRRADRLGRPLRPPS